MAAAVKLLFFHHAATLVAMVRPVVTNCSTSELSMGSRGFPAALETLICQSERQSGRAGQRSDGHFAIRHRAYLLSQVLVSARQRLPRCRAADSVHGQTMRLLRFHQGIFRPLSEQAISLQLQELLEHDRRTAVRVPVQPRRMVGSTNLL